jgi:restriction system protein
MTDSTSLEEWLTELLAADESMGGEVQLDEEADDWDEDESETGHRKSRLIWYFPSDDIRDEYLRGIDNRSEEEVRSVISHMLLPSGAFGVDHLNFEAFIALRRKPSLTGREREALLRWSESDYMKRVLNYYSGQSDEYPWLGIKWVMRLLPDHPRQALNAIESYVEAYLLSLSSNMWFALEQAEAVIRARYIGVPRSTSERLDLLRSLKSREFEHLVEHLYREMGYQTELTPPTKDGGKDIVATRTAVGMRELVFIECKLRTARKIGIKDVKALMADVYNEHANKGILVTTTDFTSGERQIESANAHIELLPGSSLVVLLNEYLGWSWPAHIESLTRPIKD